jgi:hypothetical protein
MQASLNYTTETRVINFRDKKIRINSHTPVLPPKERERRKREAEQRLFDVFSKYAEERN